ncbi:sigma-like protein [Streptomyces sp. NPDC002730]|uniref:sigma-like protein n=1 Tax=Streptomyces sp. NPDC002730 TaxID=3364662 RepID=UPI0036BCD5BA
MSNTEKKPEEITTLGDNHTPAPPIDGLLTGGPVTEAPITTQDNHTPTPPKLLDGGATTQGDNHTPLPPKG